MGDDAVVHAREHAAVRVGVVASCRRARVVVLHVPCEVASGAERLAAAGGLAHVGLATEMDLEMLLQLAFIRERPLAVVHRALEWLDGHVEALVSSQITRRAETFAACAHGTLVRLLACVGLDVFAERELAVEASSAARFMALEGSVRVFVGRRWSVGHWVHRRDLCGGCRGHRDRRVW